MLAELPSAPLFCFVFVCVFVFGFGLFCLFFVFFFFVLFFVILAPYLFSFIHSFLFFLNSFSKNIDCYGFLFPFFFTFGKYSLFLLSSLLFNFSKLFLFFSIIISLFLFLIRWPLLAQVSPPAILPGGFSFGLFLLPSAEGFAVLHSFRLSLLICSPCIVWVCFIQSFQLSFFAVFSLFGWVFLIFTRLFVFLY